MPAEAVLSVDLGGTHLRAAIVGPGGEISARQAINTPRDDPAPDALIKLLRELGARHDVGHAVVGLPGRVNYREGTLEYGPHLPSSWLPLLSRAHLSERTGLRVDVCNDAELAAAGEALFGAGTGFSDVVYLTISTGIGAGVVHDGRLVHGVRSMPEPGHTIIDAKAFEAGGRWAMEDLASGTGMGLRAQAVGLGQTGADVLAALAAGDSRAVAIWEDALLVIRAAVFNLAMWFSPQVVVIGGGIGLNAPRLVESVEEWLALHPPPGIDLAVRRAALGDDAGLAGAAAWARMGG
ncbi:MAG: ROK family protein [Candidatus Dormibacteria bacterium]